MKTSHKEPVIDETNVPVDPGAIARIVGFARTKCKKCFGRGRLGWDARFNDRAHLIPCSCIEFFDIEAIRDSYKKDKEKFEKLEAEASGPTPEFDPTASQVIEK